MWKFSSLMGKLKMQIYMEFVSFGLLQLATTNRGSRPEIQDDPGGRGEGRGRRSKRWRSRHHQQRISIPCRQRTSVDIFSAERWRRRRTKPSGDQEDERQLKTTIKRSILTQIMRILGKRTEVNGWPRYKPKSDRLKVLQDFPTWDRNRDNTLQARHFNGSDTPHSRDPRIWRG